MSSLKHLFQGLLIITALCIGTLTASAASSSKETLYLKNGSVIKGSVIEQVPGENIKIKTADGSIFVYQMNDVERITKDEAEESSGGFRGNTKRGWRTFLDLGYNWGIDDEDPDHMEVEGSFGFQFNKVFFLGAGLGVHQYFSNDWHSESATNVPFFMHIRCDFPIKKAGPFIENKFGYSAGDYKGVFGSATVGCRFALSGKSGLSIGLGYTLQDLAEPGDTFIDTDDFYSVDWKDDVAGFHLKVAFDF